jgi:hypothetical protein
MTAGAVGERPRLLVDLDGGLVHLRADYDPRLVALMRKLPDRHYVAERAEWIMPARRAALAELCELIERPELEVTLSERARRRLERHGPGRLTLDKGALRLVFAYNPRRLKRVRAIPERRFDPDSKSWIVPPTRAGALELLRLLDEGEFRAEVAVRRRLEALAAGQEGGRELRREPAASGVGGRRRLVRPHPSRPCPPPRARASCEPPRRERRMKGRKPRQPTRTAKHAPARAGSGSYQHHEQGKHASRKQQLADAAGGDPAPGRQQPHAPARQRPPEPHTGRGAGVRKHMAGVADPQAASENRRERQAQQREQEPSTTGHNHGRENRVGDRPVGGKRTEGEQGQPQQRTTRADGQVAALEPAAPMDAAAELIRIRQPGADNGRACSDGRLDGPQLGGLGRAERDRDADQLVGHVAHPNEGIAAVGRPRATSGGVAGRTRVAMLAGRRHVRGGVGGFGTA